MVGIDYLKGQDTFQPNIAHENGIAFGSLRPVPGNVYEYIDSPTIFYKDPKGSLCNQTPGPTWNPNDQAGLGFAFGDCTATIENWAAQVDNFPVPFTAVLKDSNQFVIGWHNMTSTTDYNQPINVDSKLPAQVTVAYDVSHDDHVDVGYQDQKITCTFGGFDQANVPKRSCTATFKCPNPVDQTAAPPVAPPPAPAASSSNPPPSDNCKHSGDPININDKCTS